MENILKIRNTNCIFNIYTLCDISPNVYATKINILYIYCCCNLNIILNNLIINNFIYFYNKSLQFL